MTTQTRTRARRKYLLLLVLVLTTAGYAASAATRPQKAPVKTTATGQAADAPDAALRVDLPASGEVRVENRRGGVSVEVWGEKYVSVTTLAVGARAPQRRSPVRLERSDSLLGIRVAQATGVAARRVDLRLRVPSNARVSVFTGSGEIEARDVPASLAAQTVSGNIRVDIAAPHNAELTAHSLNGEVVFQDEAEARAPRVSKKKFQTRLGAGTRVVRLFSGRGGINIATLALTATTIGNRLTSVADNRPSINENRTHAASGRSLQTDEAAAASQTDDAATTRRLPSLKGGGSGVAVGAMPSATPAPQTSETPEEVDEDEVVRVETELVRLSVGVVDRASGRGIVGLAQNDFKLYEDNAEQQITSFESASAPFDLVLLIDLSGSTAKVTNIIRAAALRFVAAARPQDRIGIMTFAGTFNVVSPLTIDREALRSRINTMERPAGDTRLYDAINSAMEQMMKESAETRRRAIVLMSDGLDSTLPNVTGVGSTLPYEDVRSRVQEFDGVFYAIWTSTEYEAFSPEDIQPETFDLVHDRMRRLAEEGGGVFYSVERLEDLAGTYERVVADLGTVYSLVYKPTNKTRDGRWRTIRIRLPHHPDAVARGKRGYFAR
ncbi:MAG TPA: VWA domain-containing protein [Pyrinomonadaceae bacterium]